MTTPLTLWGKFESLYSILAAPNIVFLKGMLFNWKMDMTQSMDGNIDEYTKMLLMLKGTN